jgi:hypothetical protein
MPEAECLEYLAVAGSKTTFYKGDSYNVPASILKKYAAHFLVAAKPTTNKDASRPTEDK